MDGKGANVLTRRDAGGGSEQLKRHAQAVEGKNQEGEDQEGAGTGAQGTL